MLPLGAALTLYAATVRWFIDPYILQGSSAGRVAGVYDGYRSIQQQRALGHDTNALVLFWGSSMIREGVDCGQLESAVSGVSAYNLAVSGDIPCRRLVELPQAKALRPERVVIGVSYPEVFEDRLPFEDQISVLPASAYRCLPPAAQQMMTAKFEAIANRSEWARFCWKRKFFLSAVFAKAGLSGRGERLKPGHATDFKAPWVYDQSINPAELKHFLAQHQNSFPPYTGNQSPSTEPVSSLAARSLALLVKELKSQGTEVVLVSMPLHPLLNEVVPASRRAALNAFLKSLSSERVKVVDYQDRLSAGNFVDLLHLSATGRVAFTLEMSRLLAAPPASANLTQVRHAL